MARIKGPKEHAELYEYLAERMGQNSPNLTQGLRAMVLIEETSKANGFLTDEHFNVYEQAYLDVNLQMFVKKKYEELTRLCEKAINFIKTMKKFGDGTILLLSYSYYIEALLNLGKKDDAKKALLEYKKQFDETNMSLLSIEKQYQVKHLLYHTYYSYYKQPFSLNGSKMINNAVAFLKNVLKSNTLSSTPFLIALGDVINETIKVRAFRQSNYLLRAFKTFQKANKNDQKKDITDDLIKSGQNPSLECRIQLLYAKHMLKILMTMKERAMAEEKLSQGMLLSKEEKSCFKIIEDCHTFDDIEVPEKDEMLDGLLKTDEIKFVYRQIQKKMRAVKASYHKKIKDDRDQCLAELKDVEQFFKITK